MKITCEHCGTGINTDKDKKCPNCGAPYSNNKEYKELKKKNKELEAREREAELHKKELGNQMMEKVLNQTSSINRINKIGVFIVVAIALIIVFAIIVSFFSTINDMNKYEKNINEKIDNFDYFDIDDYINNKEKEEVSVGFNELAVTDDFEIKCNKITNYKYDRFETEKYRGKHIVYYNFHIIFKNKSKTPAFFEDISMLYTDSEGNENVYAKKHNANIDESKKQLELFVTDNYNHEGNVTFELPDYVKNVKLVYKNVTININKYRNYIK